MGYHLVIRMTDHATPSPLSGPGLGDMTLAAHLHLTPAGVALLRMRCGHGLAAADADCLVAMGWARPCRVRVEDRDGDDGGAAPRPLDAVMPTPEGAEVGDRLAAALAPIHAPWGVRVPGGHVSGLGEWTRPWAGSRSDGGGEVILVLPDIPGDPDAFDGVPPPPPSFAQPSTVRRRSAAPRPGSLDQAGLRAAIAEARRRLAEYQRGKAA